MGEDGGLRIEDGARKVPLKSDYLSISLHQPWASWIAWGWKTIETRRHTRFKRLAGQRIAIHAANYWDPEWIQAAGRFLTEEQFRKTKSYRHALGALICSVHVIEHAPLTEHHSQSALIDCTMTAFSTRYGLILRPDIELFEPPLFIRGRQGIFKVDLSQHVTRHSSLVTSPE